jgi:UDP-glucose 4-epimerase
MTRCLVTGGAGFIGSHLATELVALGHHVRVLDSLATGSSRNLAHLGSEVELFQEDLRNLEAVRKATDGCDTVFHLGALGSVPRSVNDPITTNDVNVNGSLNVLVAARDAGVRRVIYASSSSVYGDTPILPKVETMPTRPLSPYAMSKLAPEEYCRIFHHVYGLETVALRYFNVFGPRQDPLSQYAAVIPKFMDALVTNTAPTVNGDGTQSRDFTYVGNNVHANILAMNAPAEAVAGRVFNIACNDQVTLLELLDQLVALNGGTGVAPVFQPGRAGDVKHSRADVDAAKTAFGYSPIVSFESGLRTTWEWFRSHPEHFAH